MALERSAAQSSPVVAARRQARLHMQLVSANHCQLQRRAAVATLNKLADDLLPADTLHVPIKMAVVVGLRLERLVRALQM